MISNSTQQFNILLYHIAINWFPLWFLFTWMNHLSRTLVYFRFPDFEWPLSYKFDIVERNFPPFALALICTCVSAQSFPLKQPVYVKHFTLPYSIEILSTIRNSNMFSDVYFVNICNHMEVWHSDSVTKCTSLLLLLLNFTFVWIYTGQSCYFGLAKYRR